MLSQNHLIKLIDEYSYVKKLAELEYGLMTQCLLSKTVRGNPKRGGFDKMTAANILMKFNHKLGGINTSLAEESQIALFKGSGPVMGQNICTTFKL